MMTREQAMELVLEAIPKETLIVAANGHMSRALHLHDEKRFFYMIGSMGLASSIALGLALTKPKLPLAVFDGDGNVLMSLGSLTSIAVQAPKNFFHVCFDNGQYGSTGGQRTLSPHVDLSLIAKAAGYAQVSRVDNLEDLKKTVPELIKCEGPSFLLIKVRAGGLPEGTPRVALTPPELTQRFISSINETA